MTAAARARTLPATQADPATRAQIIANARAVLDLLEKHGELPLPRWGLEYQVAADDRKHVEDLALVMGVTAATTKTAHRAVKRIGLAAYSVHAPNLDVAR